ISEDHCAIMLLFTYYTKFTAVRALERLRAYDLLNSLKDYYRAMIESRSHAEQELCWKCTSQLSSLQLCVLLKALEGCKTKEAIALANECPNHVSAPTVREFSRGKGKIFLGYAPKY
ncbi:hypothetical protein TELCIR_14673, partial [Teladorsagia circumcincta]